MSMTRCAKCGAMPPGGLLNCPTCDGATAAYCSNECQAAHWVIHGPMCRPINNDQVWGIKFLDNNHGLWCAQSEHILLDRSHPIFYAGELCPLTEQCAFPLVIYSAAYHSDVLFQEHHQPVVDRVSLHIEHYDGCAPIIRWQADRRAMCYVIRLDCQPLTKEALEIVYNYASHLLTETNNSSLGQGLAPSPELLKSFADGYRMAQRLWGRQGFDYFP